MGPSDNGGILELGHRDWYYVNGKLSQRHTETKIMSMGNCLKGKKIN